MSEFHFVLSIALGQGIILAFFLLTSKYYKTTANTWLALTLILLSALSIFDLLGNSYTPDSIWLSFLFNDLELNFLVYIPLYYFFSISTSDSLTNSHLPFYFCLPFVVDTIINIFIVSFFPIETIATHAGVQGFYEVETFASITFNLVLCYKAYHLIKDYAKNPDKKRWIYKIWQSTLVLIFAWLLLTLSGYMISSGFAVLINIFHVLISIWMFWMMYNGVVNLKLIDDRNSINLKLQDKADQEKHKNVNIEAYATLKEGPLSSNDDIQPKPNRELLANHFENINSLIVSKSLYRDENLSIDDVAQHIGMSSGYVSKIIKNATNKNFSIWINEFRVTEVKAMFRDQEYNNYTTLAIGLEAGFKSKSAFYATFKKMAGETPAKFRKKSPNS